MITSVALKPKGSGALLQNSAINQSNPNGDDKSNDDPVELLKLLSDDTKTDGAAKNDNINTDKNSSGSARPIYSGPTPPPSGISSKSIPKKQNVSIEKMFETFYQSPSGEFKPTFYNPFEVRHRRRTSRSQFKILERAFMENCKPSAVVRKALAQELNMSARSIQVWFQNRRAKLKTMLKNGKMTDLQMMEYLNQQQQKEEKDELDENDQDYQDSPSSFEESEGSEPENITPNNSSNQPQQQQPDKVCKMTRVFTTTERRNFPNNATHNERVNVHDSEMMSYGNSYPNQSRNRSYSLPTIQRSPQLPFKQLQEALFGSNNNTVISENPSHQSQNGQVLQPFSPLDHNQGYLQHHSSLPYPTQQIPIHASQQAYYNTSLNAFQHYYRASNAVMSQVANNNGSSNVPSHNNIGNYYNSQGQPIPIQVHFTPLEQAVEVDYQVDPNRLRPRSSSFAVGQRVGGQQLSNSSSSSSFSSTSSSYDFLSAIKEDSPISEYMSIPHNSYFDGNDQDSSVISNQINSYLQSQDCTYPCLLQDKHLDYFMSTNGNSGNYNLHHQNSSYYESSHPSSLMGSSPEINESNNNCMNELAFLPQPTNEILLSTLIDDEHFLQ